MFEDVALHALLLSGHTGASAAASTQSALQGQEDTGGPTTGKVTTTASPLAHKQRVAQLYSQSIAKRAKFASSLQLRSFNSATPSGSASASGKTRFSGPKAPRSWDAPGSDIGGSASASTSGSASASGSQARQRQGQQGSSGSHFSSRGTFLQSIAAAVAEEAEAEAEAAAVAGPRSGQQTTSGGGPASARPRVAAEAYDAHFLRPSPTSLSNADMRVGSESRLAAAAVVRPEWRRSATLEERSSGQDAISVGGRDGTEDESGMGLNASPTAEQNLIAALADRFRRLACFGLLDVFQDGSKPDDRLTIESQLEGGLSERIPGCPAPSLVDLCLITLAEAFEPEKAATQAQAHTVPSSRRRRRRRRREAPLIGDDQTSSEAELAEILQQQEREAEFNDLQHSLQMLPAHLKSRAAVFSTRLARVRSPHVVDFLLSLHFGAEGVKTSSSKIQAQPAPDDWESEEALADLSVASVSHETDAHDLRQPRTGVSQAHATEMDLSFLPLSLTTLDRFLGLTPAGPSYASNIRALSLAGLNQRHLQGSASGSQYSTADEGARFLPADILRALRLLPSLEVLSLAGSCLYDPTARSSGLQRRAGSAGQSSGDCSCCDQVFAASLGDMMFDVSMSHPQPSASTFLTSLARATPRLTVLDLSATCWIDDQVLKSAPWQSAAGDGLTAGVGSLSLGQSGARTSTWTGEPATATSTFPGPQAAGAENRTDATTHTDAPGPASRSNPIWLKLEKLLLRGCPHLITHQPPGSILSEWTELTVMPYTRKRHLEQRRDIILAATKWKRSDLACFVRGQRTRTDPAVRWTEIVWDY